MTRNPLRSPGTGPERPRTDSLSSKLQAYVRGPQASRVLVTHHLFSTAVEKLWMKRAFPVEVGGAKKNIRAHTVRSLRARRATAGFVLRFACFEKSDAYNSHPSPTTTQKTSSAVEHTRTSLPRVHCGTRLSDRSRRRRSRQVARVHRQGARRPDSPDAVLRPNPRPRGRTAPRLADSRARRCRWFRAPLGSRSTRQPPCRFGDLL